MFWRKENREEWLLFQEFDSEKKKKQLSQPTVVSVEESLWIYFRLELSKYLFRQEIYKSMGSQRVGHDWMTKHSTFKSKSNR